jgi:nucleotide-binding universal stress UspA family protein
MAYKDILVHLDIAPRSDVRLNIAAALAARHGAHLAGLYIIELPSLGIFTGETSIFDVRMADEILRQGRERAKAMSDAVTERFETALHKYSINGEWRCIDALAADTVAAHARYADLAIVGQNDPDLVTFGEDRIPEAAILESGRPILVIPHFGEVAPIGNTVLIGWKSGREAARAVNDALPFLSDAQSVTVLAIDPQKGISKERTVPAADISLHLARHGITATGAHTVSEGIAEGDILLNYASDLGADLIVAGGYGHSRAREFVLGGTTRSLLATMTVPVLFSH